MNSVSDFKTLPSRARFVIFLFGVAGLLSAAWASSSGDVLHYGRLGFLALLGAVTAQAKVKLSKTSTLSLLNSVVMLPGILAASLTYYVVNSLSISLIVAMTEFRSVFKVWCDHFLMAAPSFLSAGLLSLAVVEVAGTLVGSAILLSLLYFSYVWVRMAGQWAAGAAECSGLGDDSR